MDGLCSLLYCRARIFLQHDILNKRNPANFLFMYSCNHIYHKLKVGCILSLLRTCILSIYPVCGRCTANGPSMSSVVFCFAQSGEFESSVLARCVLGVRTTWAFYLKGWEGRTLQGWCKQNKGKAGCRIKESHMNYGTCQLHGQIYCWFAMSTNWSNIMQYIIVNNDQMCYTSKSWY